MRCDVYVKTVVLIVQSAKDKIISNLILPVLLMDEISLSWLSQAAVIDQDNPLWTSLELELFLVSSVAPLFMGVQRNVTSSRLFANELVPRVMALLVGNHVDLPDRETCHVSLIHLFVSLQMSGPIAYK